MMSKLSLAVSIIFAIKLVQCCPKGDLVDKILLHFRPDQPRGIPGLDIVEPTVLAPSMSLGPLTIVNPEIFGLSGMILHNFSINAHSYNATMSITFPLLELRAIYQIPGLWWTTEGNFTVTLNEVSADTELKIAVLDDSCFFIEDFKSNITKSNISYSTDGSEDGAGMLGLFFDDFVNVLVNMTKPAILKELNEMVRYTMTSFLPNENINIHNYLDHPLPEYNATAYDTPPRIPPMDEQKRALISLVRYQIPWLLGQPVLLPDAQLNLGVAQLHNMSVHNLDRVSDVQHLSLVYDGETFTIKTLMLHQSVFNRHRVLWFPNTLLKFWQWTQAQMGLVKHSGVVKLDRRMYDSPYLVHFMTRPVVFNPDSANAMERTMSRMSRRLMDAIRTDFGDTMSALLYRPLKDRLNDFLESVDARILLRNFVCSNSVELENHKPIN